MDVPFATPVSAPPAAQSFNTRPPKNELAAAGDGNGDMLSAQGLTTGYRAAEIARQIHLAVAGENTSASGELRLDAAGLRTILNACDKELLETADRILKQRYGYTVRRAVDVFQKDRAGRAFHAELSAKLDAITRGEEITDSAAIRGSWVDARVAIARFMRGCSKAVEQFLVISALPASPRLQELTGFCRRFQQGEFSSLAQRCPVSGPEIRAKLYPIPPERQEQLLGRVIQLLDERTELFKSRESERLGLWACAGHRHPSFYKHPLGSDPDLHSTPEEILENLSTTGLFPGSATKVYRRLMTAQVSKMDFKPGHLGIFTTSAAGAGILTAGANPIVTAAAVLLATRAAWKLTDRLDRRSKKSPLCRAAAVWAFSDYYSPAHPAFMMSTSEATQVMGANLSSHGYQYSGEQISRCISLIRELIVLGVPHSKILKTARQDELNEETGRYDRLEALKERALRSMGITDAATGSAVALALKAKMRIERLMDQQTAQDIAVAEIASEASPQN